MLRKIYRTGDCMAWDMGILMKKKRNMWLPGRTHLLRGWIIWDRRNTEQSFPIMQGDTALQNPGRTAESWDIFLISLISREDIFISGIMTQKIIGQHPGSRLAKISVSIKVNVIMAQPILKWWQITARYIQRWDTMYRLGSPTRYGIWKLPTAQTENVRSVWLDMQSLQITAIMNRIRWICSIPSILQEQYSVEIVYVRWSMRIWTALRMGKRLITRTCSTDFSAWLERRFLPGVVTGKNSLEDITDTTIQQGLKLVYYVMREIIMKTAVELFQL